ncbi:MAG TPA: sulfur oxidation c-type cytochrome SoxA [Burkholderiales bacterium]|nr:sulfur oxidation c-type cytochrome SoxA [Burkholderiales bacterium]
MPGTRKTLRLAAFAFSGFTALATVGAELPIPRSALKQGSEFAGAEVRAMQADEFGNPGMLWVMRGERLWFEPAGREVKACASCHGDASTSMKGVATRYPQVDAAGGQLVNIAGRVNICRERHQHAEALPLESEPLLALASYVTFQSRGLPMSVKVDGEAATHFARARERYYRRLGQMNLSCAHCHDQSWGRTLFNETVSQGHGTGWPGYRLEWQTFGSLQRRLRACYSGLRAEMPEYGSRELIELELFLAWRATGLPIEAPGVRR